MLVSLILLNGRHKTRVIALNDDLQQCQSGVSLQKFEKKSGSVHSVTFSTVRCRPAIGGARTFRKNPVGGGTQDPALGHSRNASGAARHKESLCFGFIYKINNGKGVKFKIDMVKNFVGIMKGDELLKAELLLVNR